MVIIVVGVLAALAIIIALVAGAATWAALYWAGWLTWKVLGFPLGVMFFAVIYATPMLLVIYFLEGF